MPGARQDHPAQGAGYPPLVEPGRRLLIAVAALKEAEAVVAALAPGADVPPPWTPAPVGRADLLVTGVGKANAAGAVARALDPTRHGGVLSTGVCGSMPGGPPIGACVLASGSVFADEGLETPGEFLDCRGMGFPLSPGDSDAFAPSETWRGVLAPLAQHGGVIATVSTCSGTDALAARVAARTGAVAEAMEGAAVGLAVVRVAPAIPFAELRVVSNTTGDRARQRWDLAGALDALARVLGRLPL